MQIHGIHDSSDSYVMKLLEEGMSKITDPRLVENYHPDYRDRKSNLFNILEDENGRFKKGCYYILEDDGKFICAAGWNEYELDRDIALLLTRMYTDPNHRVKYYIAQHILPLLIEETKHYKYVWGTVNEYNKRMYDWFLRIKEGKAGALFNNWPDIYKDFEPLGRRKIYYTEQYILQYNKK